MKKHPLVNNPKELTIIKYLFVIFILIACNSEPTQEVHTDQVLHELNGSITISGAEALYPLMNIWVEEFSREKPNLKIEVLKNSSEKGLANLLSGNINLAMVSRNLTSAEEAIGLWYFTVSNEGVIPIISAKNPYLKEILDQGIDRTTLLELFTTDNEIHWGNILGTSKNNPVKVFIRSDNSGTAEVWSDYLGVEQKDLTGFPLSGDEKVVKAVIQEPLSLSFCNAHNAYNLKENKIRKGLRILPIDFNNNGRIDSKEQFYKDLCTVQRAAYLGKYPSHLCRELYLVSIGKPSKPAILEFLKWIYTDGQKIAVKSGYAELRQCHIRELLKLIEELEQHNE